MLRLPPLPCGCGGIQANLNGWDARDIRRCLHGAVPFGFSLTDFHRPMMVRSYLHSKVSAFCAPLTCLRLPTTRLSSESSPRVPKVLCSNGQLSQKPDPVVVLLLFRPCVRSNFRGHRLTSLLTQRMHRNSGDQKKIDCGNSQRIHRTFEQLFIAIDHPFCPASTLVPFAPQK